MPTKKQKDEGGVLRVHIDLYDEENKPLVKAGKTIAEERLSASTVRWLLKDGLAEKVEDEA